VIGFFAFSPYFWGDGEIALNTGKYSFKRGIVTLHFGEKYASLPLLIFDEPWWMHALQVPSGLLVAMEYLAIAAV